MHGAEGGLNPRVKLSGERLASAIAVSTFGTRSTCIEIRMAVAELRLDLQLQACGAPCGYRVSKARCSAIGLESRSE